MLVFPRPLLFEFTLLGRTVNSNNGEQAETPTRALGIDKGLYYYDPKNHQLCLLKQKDANVDLMVSLAKQTIASETEPHLVILITARFQRLSHKYRAVTYSLILKHVGVLYQTMYLVAKSMDLAPCGMGGSESDLFAIATGIDYLEESQVGEFSLGNA